MARGSVVLDGATAADRVSAYETFFASAARLAA
jgi:hypothetical protein